MSLRESANGLVPSRRAFIDDEGLSSLGNIPFTLRHRGHASELPPRSARNF
jgi:hypothetical protein